MSVGKSFYSKNYKYLGPTLEWGLTGDERVFDVRYKTSIYSLCENLIFYDRFLAVPGLVMCCESLGELLKSDFDTHPRRHTYGEFGETRRPNFIGDPAHKYIQDGLFERELVKITPSVVMIGDLKLEILGPYRFSFTNSAILAVVGEEDCGDPFTTDYKATFGQPPKVDVSKFVPLLQLVSDELIDNLFFMKGRVPHKFGNFSLQVMNDKVFVRSNRKLSTWVELLNKQGCPLKLTEQLFCNIFAHRLLFEVSSLAYHHVYNTDYSDSTLLLPFRPENLAQYNRNKEILTIKEITLGESRAFSNAVQNGSITMSEVFSVIDNSIEIRDWFGKNRNSSFLVADYVRELRRVSVWDQLPVRTARWLTTTAVGVGADLLGAGGIGTVSATALSALDQFFINPQKLGKKTPGLFIDQLQRTLDKKV